MTRFLAAISIAVLALGLSLSASSAQNPAADSQLCFLQLDLLLSGDKLTEQEAANFENQCNCLELNEQNPAADAPCVEDLD